MSHNLQENLVGWKGSEYEGLIDELYENLVGRKGSEYEVLIYLLFVIQDNSRTQQSSELTTVK